MNIKLKVYNKNKYYEDSQKIAETTYKNIKNFEVKKMSVNEIIAQGFDEFDDYDEYLIITLENDEKATFRNSYVDLFKI